MEDFNPKFYQLDSISEHQPILTLNMYMTQWHQFVSLYIEVARKNMYTFKVLILYKKFVMKATYVMIQIIKGNPG